MDTADSEADLTFNSGARYFVNPDQYSGLNEAIENAIHMHQQKSKYNTCKENKSKEEDL
jgi:predicted mannosyl-3-phosphoglycerate phosphatase (HAD superfamily)